jgi:murein L,D-transpeptidase YafK
MRAGSYHGAADELEAARADVAIVHAGWTGLHARFSEPGLRRQWQQWASETIATSRQSGEAAILIDKLRRQVHLYRGGRLTASFPAELGANGLRRKEHSGDRATPEGRYRVTQRKDGRSTRYYKALLINYPNDEDRMRFALGKVRGIIPTRVSIGNLIEIHGEGGEGRDWTEGCVALANPDMDRVFALAEEGTPVTIVGTYER